MQQRNRSRRQRFRHASRTEPRARGGPRLALGVEEAEPLRPDDLTVHADGNRQRREVLLFHEQPAREAAGFFDRRGILLLGLGDSRRRNRCGVSVEGLLANRDEERYSPGDQDREREETRDGQLEISTKATQWRK